MHLYPNPRSLSLSEGKPSCPLILKSSHHMIHFQRHTLDNGLRVLLHEDDSTPMIAVNVLYHVGSRDESPERTGFAHLFEHLMFGGSEHVKDFDTALQLAGGESNAFTNFDLTNFYNLLPAENVETAFWLESDRMMALNINARSLEVQRKVVTEEYKETCLNQPYGSVGHELARLVYRKHPYRWPVIGQQIEHIAEAQLEDVRAFYQKYYCPNNAILVVAGNFKTDAMLLTVEKWFGGVARGPELSRALPAEPAQTELRRHMVQADVPVTAVYMAFRMPERMHEDYYAIDLLSDVLGNGQSSRLFRRLRRVRKLFTEIDCYVSGTVDPGMFVIEGKLAEGVTTEQAEIAVWEELDHLRDLAIDERELQKLKNKSESTLLFSETNVLNKAINLAFYEMVDTAEHINEEAARYRAITAGDVQRVARQYLIPTNCSVLWYEASTPIPKPHSSNVEIDL